MRRKPTSSKNDDLSATIAFYQSKLGFDVRYKGGGDGRACWIEGLPTTLLYDRHGVLRWKIIGFEYTSVVEGEVKRIL